MQPTALRCPYRRSLSSSGHGSLQVGRWMIEAADYPVSAAPADESADVQVATVHERTTGVEPRRHGHRRRRAADRPRRRGGSALGCRALLGRPRSLCACCTSVRAGHDGGLPPVVHAQELRDTKTVRATFAILGSMTMQGPLTQWVTDHRKHHALSDLSRATPLAACRVRPRHLELDQGLRPCPRGLALPAEGHGAGRALRQGSLR